MPIFWEILGHEDFEEVEIKDNYYGIDTGCVYGRKLTVIELPSMHIIYVKFNNKDLTVSLKTCPKNGH